MAYVRLSAFRSLLAYGMPPIRASVLAHYRRWPRGRKLTNVQYDDAVRAVTYQILGHLHGHADTPGRLAWREIDG